MHHPILSTILVNSTEERKLVPQLAPPSPLLETLVSTYAVVNLMHFDI